MLFAVSGCCMFFVCVVFSAIVCVGLLFVLLLCLTFRLFARFFVFGVMFRVLVVLVCVVLFLICVVVFLYMCVFFCLGLLSVFICVVLFVTFCFGL